MMLVPILLLIGCVAALALTTLADDPDRRSLAFGLALVWVAAMALWFTNRLDLLPILDWLIGMQAVAIARYRTEKWVRFFIALIALRLTLHVVDYLAGHAYLVLYIHGLNATFAFLLMVVSHAGGVHARDHLLGHLSRSRAGLRHSLRAPPPRLAS